MAAEQVSIELVLVSTVNANIILGQLQPTVYGHISDLFPFVELQLSLKTCDLVDQKLENNTLASKEQLFIYNHPNFLSVLPSQCMS